MSPVRSSRFAASSCSTNQGWSPSGRSSIVAHGVGEPGSSSREPKALRKASVNVRPMPIASPTDFICVPSVGSAPGNFSNAKRGNLTTT